MACEKQTDRMISYAAGKLAEPERIALERHLGECETCRRVADAQKRVWAVLDAYPVLAPADDFDRRLYARIAEDEQRAWWRQALDRYFSPFAIRSGVPVAAACLSICAAFVLRLPSPPALQSGGGHPVAVEHRINVDQVERALDDLDMLKQLTAAPVDKEDARAPESQS